MSILKVSYVDSYSSFGLPGTLYLFGGWNGTEDLDDLWSFDTNTERWSLLCAHSRLAGGPAPRSCHKMVFDPVHRRLYTVGRYLDNAQRVPAEMNVSRCTGFCKNFFYGATILFTCNKS